MKLQHLAIVFVIIIMPISLIMASYIQNQIDAIEIQTAFDNGLINATYGAVKAFQLNTTNNKYSSISDSKIRDIEASVNTFYTLLLGSLEDDAYSTNDLQMYVPALLYTLYDGYYIYSSYDNVYSTTGADEDEKVQITLDGNNFQNGLKPYVYYSAKYKLRNGNIIVVNYTLDNEITVYGDFGGKEGYVTKSGYLINPDLVTNVNTGSKTLTYDGITIEPEELTEHLITIEDQTTGATKSDDYRYIFYQNKKVYQDHDDGGNLLYNDDGSPKIFWYDNYMKTYVNDAEIREYAKNCNMLSTSAFDYYYEAQEFSEWVRDNLGDITQADTIRSEDGITTIGSDTEYLSENTGNEKIFYADKDNDPMLSSSAFNNHRIAVIRKSIETNLGTVIANYRSTSLYNYAMPVMSDEDWYKILNNVSLVSFLQGMSIGYRMYNNYAVITNNINKEVVTAENVYIVAKNKDTNSREYHKPGCEDLIQGIRNGTMEIVGAYPIASFQRQTVRISEADERHYYLQACNGDELTGCYNCIVNATADYNTDDIIDGTIEHYEDENNIIYDSNDIAEIRKSYLTALARERYDLYKSNFDLSNLGKDKKKKKNTV